MRSSNVGAFRSSLLLAAIATVFVGIAYFRGNELKGGRVAAAIAEAGLICPADMPTLSEDLAFLTQGTRFQGRVAINATPAPGILNVIFFCLGEPTPAHLGSLVRNCAYVGQPAVVVCDKDFLDGFLDRSGIAGELRTVPSLADSRRQARRMVALWVLGHELGHILSAHEPAHFSSGALERPATPNTLDHDRELQADAWFVAKLRDHPDMRLDIERLLLDLVYGQVRSKVGSENLHPGTGVPITSDLVEYAEDGSHPEFVIRATRMLSFSFADRPGAGPMRYQIDALVRTLRRTAPRDSRLEP